MEKAVDMAYEVLARKWRPQQFEDVVGQGHVTQTLRNAITSDRIAHAYLFVGPRGIGKTSIARIFSKALNCETGPTPTPCGVCDACREITAGNSLDVLEIDGASNNGVDQVRELRETVKYRPVKGSFKIYIIDEVHMLSTAAFNALLKTLEEPPAHVKFIFATTEPDKILATIVSRCQRFDLRRIPSRLIMERLREIAEAEGVSITDDALLAIARGAEGGLRDAESALDQLISFRGKELGEEDVLAVFGLVSRESLEALAEHVLAGRIGEVVSGVHALDKAGKDLRRLTVELIEHFRNLLIVLNVETIDETLDLTEAQVAKLRAQATLTDTERALRITGVLTETEDRMRATLSRRTLLETSLIRCARAATVVSIDDILRKLSALASGAPVAATPPQGGADLTARPAPTAAPAAPVAAPPPRPPAAVQEARRPTSDKVARVPDEVDTDRDLQALLSGWQDVLQQVARFAAMAKRVLADARPVEVTPEKVVVALDPEFAGELDALQSPRNRKAVEQVLSKVLHRRVVPEFIVGQSGLMDTPAAPPASTAVVQEPAPEPYETEASEAPVASARSLQEWSDEPAVRKTLDMFNGSIEDVRE